MRWRHRAGLACALALVACQAVESVPVDDGGADAADATIPAESGTADAARDVGAPRDAGSDALAIADCMSPPPAAYAWVPPTGFHQARCAPEDILAFDKACLTPSSGGGDCKTWLSAHADCYACLETKDTDPAWGPLIAHASQGTVELNLTGCIAAFEDAGAPCARAQSALAECENAVCASCLTCNGECAPGTPSPCLAYAGKSACAPVADASACAGLLGDGGAAAECVRPTTFEDAFKYVALLFCGANGASYPTDAGGDASADADAADQ